MTYSIPYFDGHNDVLLRLAMKAGGDPVADFLNGDGEGHIDLPRARQGNMVGGLFAMFPPPLKRPDFTKGLPGGPPPMLSADDAWKSTRKMMSIFYQIARQSNGAVSICHDAAEIRAAIAKKSLATVFHIEGAEVIEEDLDMLHVLHGAGLRSLGPVWSRETIFGHGVPFKFPNSPDTGPGLTDAGKRLVAECNALNVLIDLSHLNEKGFWDVAELSDAPLVATHSNVHSICNSARNLTDRQLDAIKASNGFVGLNFATGFLRDDGKMVADTDLEWLVRHTDALIEKLGEDNVGIGADFDGAMVPAEIKDVSGVQKLFDALATHGYDHKLLCKIGTDNWLGALERIWRH